MSTPDQRKPTPNQLAKDLPGPIAYLTGHDEETGKAIIHSKRPVEWHRHDNDTWARSVVYTNQSHPDLNKDADIVAHDKVIQESGGQPGIVLPGGAILGHIDVAPENTSIMHRTQSIDYAVVLEGTIESILDSGERVLLGRGDVMVQRATMHAWRNPSKTDWARMLFCIQDCQPLYVGGQRMGEDLSGTNVVPASSDDS